MFKFDLLENEKLVANYRQTEAVLFKPVLLVFILIYGPWYFLLKYELAASYDRLLLFWTFLVLIYAINKYALWLLNVYLITSKRIIIINYKNIFNKQVLESPLERILNISFTVKGFWASLFSFGSVEVQVAGLPEPMIIKKVAHPSEVKDFLWKLHSQKPFMAAPVQPKPKPTTIKAPRVV
ncbi:MAG: PH domain-containing protein [Candidatus Doudnabacteria bacterium]|nr:PH domain-containing protein [Candidatus Doudnabacteria bacterium]